MADKQTDRGWSNHQRILPQLYEQLRLPLMEYWTALCYSINGFTITYITNSDTYSDAIIEQFYESQYIHCKILTFECEIFLWQNSQAIFLDLVMVSERNWKLLLSLLTQEQIQLLSLWLMTLPLQNCLFQSLFRLHWWLLLASLKTNSTRFGRTHVMHWETNWPQM